MNKAKIHYYDIGDYLSREDKLNIIKRFGSIARIPWTIIEPNEHGDWINHRNEMFKKFIPMGNKEDKKNEKTFFVPYYSNGLKTNRDIWCYNSNKNKLIINIKECIDFYNNEVDRFQEAIKDNLNIVAQDFINYDPSKFSWDRAQKETDLPKGRKYSFNAESVRLNIYRPFFKQWSYLNRQLNNCVYQLPQLFPTLNHRNLVICVSGIGVTKDFSCIITDTLPDLELIGKSQCFPLYWYKENEKTFQTGGEGNLFEDESNKISYIRRDGVTDWIQEAARKQYGYKVTKEDIFYYVYGILHSPEYRTTFSTDLKKSLPRLPLVENADDFWAFSEAGRELAKPHINYETVDPYRKCQVVYAPLTTKGESMNYRVEKMRFAKKDSKTADKSIIHYNAGITIENIPAEAYEYVVNGKSAIEWIMERYAVTTDKKSGITNDPNDWAKEHEDEKYILNLLLRIINVSVQTVEIVKGLPKLKFE